MIGRIAISVILGTNLSTPDTNLPSAIARFMQATAEG